MTATGNIREGSNIREDIAYVRAAAETGGVPQRFRRSTYCGR